MKRKTLLFVIGAILVALWSMRANVYERVGTEVEPAAIASSDTILIVDLLDGTTAEQIAALEQKYEIDIEYTSDYSEDEALLQTTTPLSDSVIAALSKDPLVEALEAPVEFAAFSYPNDPMFEKQWNLRAIGIEMPWRASNGAGIKVAVLDTGISQVEDLMDTNFGPGYSFVPGKSTAEDDHGHGTHVAGTIAQSTNNGVGVAGVAPGVTLLPYKVLGAEGGGQSAWIAAAIDQAADEGADIINMSLGSTRYSRVVHIAIQKAVARGVVVVAAAGNRGVEGVGYPGRLKEVIGVSAVGPSLKLAPYSSWGNGVEIAAPGGNLRVKDGGILQDTVDGRGGHAYRSFQGTSMASPHVAGSIAVLMGMGLDGQAAVDALLGGATATGSDGIDKKYGYGVMDLRQSVSNVLMGQWGMRFLVGGLLASFFVLFAGLSPAAMVVAGVSAAFAAGGLFFLPYLGVSPNGVMAFLSRGMLDWPSALGNTSWVHFPIWCSAAIPVVLSFLFGMNRFGGMVVTGISAGFGVSLLHAAMAGSVDVWWLSSTLDGIWLWGNGILCLLAALAVVGVHSARGAKQ